MNAKRTIRLLGLTALLLAAMPIAAASAQIHVHFGGHGYYDGHHSFYGGHYDHGYYGGHGYYDHHYDDGFYDDCYEGYYYPPVYYRPIPPRRVILPKTRLAPTAKALTPAAPRNVAPLPGKSLDASPPLPAPKTSTNIPPGLLKLSPQDRAVALAQRTCPVTGDLLGENNAPFKVRIGNRDIFVCCQGCIKDLQSNPAAYLPNLKK